MIISLSCQILQCLIFLQMKCKFFQAIFLILLYQLFKKAMYQQILCSRNFYYGSTLSLNISPKLIFKCEITLYNICKDLLNLRKFLPFQGLQKAVILNGWDMAFKTLLYTRNIQTNNYLDIIQLITFILMKFYKQNTIYLTDFNLQ
ncbi:unnamed protein product [Paramecium octaurelia]|uniref:Transmembrane protein n=1 Tax=Paramecium octaurelia TaxID=43137 RepID=A0A8S1UU75_PAROT|nr:unnamed protein product [Paramecium octaurelia]